MEISNYSDIFLDRDGVINEVVYRNTAISSPRTIEEFIFTAEISEFIERFKKTKNFYVVTNQPDISRGLLKLEILEKMHEMILSKLSIKKILYCPHTDSDNCGNRKPNPGMINQLIKEFNLKKDNCLLIGDTSKDMEAAYKAKISSVLIKKPYNEQLNKAVFIDSLLNLKK